MEHVPPFSEVQILAPYYLERPIRVRAAESGLSLVDFLTSRMPYRPQEFWINRIEQGFIKYNGQIMGLSTVTHAGQQFVHCIHDLREPSVPTHIPVLYEDENLIVVHKPAPLPVHPGGRYNYNSLTHILAKKFERPFFVVHRLDAVTSGIVILAKSQKQAQNWTSAFQANRIQKEYLALVRLKESSRSIGEEWSCNLPIGRYKSFVFCTDNRAQNPKNALTKFRLITQLDNHCALIACSPITGRTHQIRLHAEALGHPILGDQIYDGTNNPPKEHRFQNQAIALQNSLIGRIDQNFSIQLEAPDLWLQKSMRSCLFEENQPV